MKCKSQEEWIIWELLRKVTSLGPNLWPLRKVTSLNLWPFEMSQVWAQTCDLLKCHKFELKLVNIGLNLWPFSPNLWHSERSQVGTKGHKCGLKSHKFGLKGHKVKPMFTSLSPNLWPFERSQVWAQTCDISKSHKFKLVTFRKGHKFGPKLVPLLNNSQLGIIKKSHKFGPKLVTFTKGHKFKLVTFQKVTSLGPNLWLL